MNDTRTNEFRTAADIEKLKSAEKVSAKHDELVANATTALASAEAACAEDPSDANLKKAKEARRVLDDAEQGQSLARSHASRVSREIAAAEANAIRKEIARREATLEDIVDSETLELAVELAICSVELQQRIRANVAQHRAEVEDLNALRARVGTSSVKVPDERSLVDRAALRIAEVGLSAQAQLGLRARDIGLVFPAWREGFTWCGEIKEYATGVERFSVTGRTGDGTPITMGTDRTPLVREAKALLERVKARRTDRPGGSTLARIASVATTAAPVIALATAAALTMAGG